jgi:hypothetical protein
MPSRPRTTVETVRHPRTREAAASGAALGAFVGSLVGLSGSPVVASIASAGVALAATVATAKLRAGSSSEAPAKRADQGQEESKESAPVITDQTHVFLTFFGVLGLATVVLALAARTHNVLSPTPRQIVDLWRDAGLTDEEAQQIAVNAMEGHIAVAPTPKAVVDRWRQAGLPQDQAVQAAVNQLDGRVETRLEQDPAVLVHEWEDAGATHRQAVVAAFLAWQHQRAEPQTSKPEASGAASHDSGTGEPPSIAAASFHESVLVGEERSFCDEVLQAVDNYDPASEIVASAFKKRGAAWQKEYAKDTAIQGVEDQRKALRAFAATHCKESR